jgi:urea transport system permease protein
MPRIHIWLFALALFAAGIAPAKAQQADLNAVLETHRSMIERPSRTTIGPILDALVASGASGLDVFLEGWREKLVWQRKSDGRFFFVRALEADTFMLIDVDSGEDVASVDKTDIDNLKPNSGVRGSDRRRAGAVPAVGSGPRIVACRRSLRLNAIPKPRI